MRSPVFTRIGVFASLLALLATLGGHWYVLQVFAWTNMLVRYSQSDSLARAIGNTFDGKHPCALCLKIRDGRQQQEREEQKLPSPSRDATLDLFYQDEKVAAPTRPSDVLNLAPFGSGSPRLIVYCPPKPPPRS